MIFDSQTKHGAVSFRRAAWSAGARAGPTQCSRMPRARRSRRAPGPLRRPERRRTACPRCPQRARGESVRDSAPGGLASAARLRHCVEVSRCRGDLPRRDPLRAACARPGPPTRCHHPLEGSPALAFSKQPSYLKRQKEQQRVARANQKREERRARKNSKGAGGEQQDGLDPSLDGVDGIEGMDTGVDSDAEPTEAREPAAE